jgi:hypothetical protein
MKAVGRARYLTPTKRRDILEMLGYMPHPGLPEGRLPIPLSDGSLTALYVTPKHTSIGVTEPALIKSLYETAQRG